MSRENMQSTYIGMAVMVVCVSCSYIGGGTYIYSKRRGQPQSPLIASYAPVE